MIETTILTNLINNEEYIRKVLPYVKEEYFQDHVDRSIYNEIVGYKVTQKVDEAIKKNRER